jgi:hypothetical protein
MPKLVRLEQTKSHRGNCYVINYHLDCFYGPFNRIDFDLRAIMESIKLSESLFIELFYEYDQTPIGKIASQNQFKSFTCGFNIQIVKITFIELKDN